MNILNDEINNLLEKKAIESVTQSHSRFYSLLFCVLKPYTNKTQWRPCLNLRKLNNFIFKEHFKMESLNTVKQLLQRND